MPTQRYLKGKTVLDAARERMAFLFNSFESIVVSISGGKDSTVLCHLALAEADRRDRRIGVHFLDEEVVYKSSVEQVDYLMSMFPDSTKRMWLQIPFLLTNSTSTTEGQLMAWEPGKHKVWMRTKRADAIKARPWAKEDEVAHKPGHQDADVPGFYGVIENFARTFENTAFLVGLRAAGESPNRWRAVTKNPVTVGSRRVFWGTQKRRNFTFYPIYDWNYYDVWRYIHDSGLHYSKIYDHQFRTGYHPSRMRVSSLIHEKSFKAICDLPAFEPDTYERLLKRIKGISLAQEAGKASKLFAVRKLPKNYKSWIVYRDFLLATYQDAAHRPIFERRFARQLVNEYVARQQCRQLILNDYENNLTVDNRPDPRDELIRYYDEVL